MAVSHKNAPKNDGTVLSQESLHINFSLEKKIYVANLVTNNERRVQNCNTLVHNYNYEKLIKKTHISTCT